MWAERVVYKLIKRQEAPVLLLRARRVLLLLLLLVAVCFYLTLLADRLLMVGVRLRGRRTAVCWKHRIACVKHRSGPKG